MMIRFLYDCAHCGQYFELTTTYPDGQQVFVNMRGRPDIALCRSCKYKEINRYRIARGMDPLPLDDYKGV